MIYQTALDNFKKLYMNTYNVQIFTKIFSDNIVIAIAKEDDIQLNAITKTLIIELAAYIQVLALDYSLLTRGSIVIDDFYIDDIFVYGKALTKAYALENTVAIYPRIIVAAEDACDLRESNYIREYLNKDFDGIYYLDTFSCYFSIKKIYNEDEIKHIRQLLWTKTSEYNTEKINQKVYWIINLFNKFCIANNLDKYTLDIDKIPRLSNYLKEAFENKQNKENINIKSAIRD